MAFRIRLLAVLALALVACSCKNAPAARQEQTRQQLYELLADRTLPEQSRYAVINRIANSYYAQKDYSRMVLFLTDWVEKNPGDTYDAYWLLMVAQAYLEQDAEPIAEYYFERILKYYPDLLVQEKSIHLTCLQHLIQITKTPASRIAYFNELVSRFPSDVNATEMYVRLAQEYEKEGEWNQVLRSYAQFLEQPDASTIQIAGIPDAYNTARQMVDFSKSAKDWTFESLDALETAVKTAINRYDARALDRCRSKVNFFAMSWRANESDANALEYFSMRNFMRGNRIRYEAKLDESSNPNEAYLKTRGWSPYINIWYLYFRKINYPVDPDIHGRWEWAGIYYGEKL